MCQVQIESQRYRLSSLSQRRCLGDRLLSRVGRRAFERPLAISGRLYKLLDVPDPYDPEPEARRWQAKLGPVSLRLGENRRQPAPHLRPKPAASSKPSRPAFNPRGVPEAKRTAPPPQPRPTPQSRRSRVSPESQLGDRHLNLAASVVPPFLWWELPIRPDMAEQIRKAQAEGKPTPKAPQAAEPTTETPNRRHSFAQPYRGVSEAARWQGCKLAVPRAEALHHPRKLLLAQKLPATTSWSAPKTRQRPSKDISHAPNPAKQCSDDSKY